MRWGVKAGGLMWAGLLGVNMVGDSGELKPALVRAWQRCRCDAVERVEYASIRNIRSMMGD